MTFRFLTFVLLSLVALQGFAAGLPDFTDLIEQNSAKVVKITTTQTASSSRGVPDLRGVPAPYRRFFEEQQPRESQSMGSGFVISSDGYLLTNHHVIEGADEILVRLNDRSEYIAELVGTDPNSDLALLKIDASGLSAVEFADAKSLEVGEWVIAIGSPFGLDYSASAGIVSAIGRSLPKENGSNYVPFVQTDVAINPGNSGGPLFNMKGQVVGVNSQIYTRSGGYMGLSFAIPANVAKDVIKQLKNNGTVVRGYLGVVIQDVDADLAESFNLDKPAGALVSRVIAGAPAEEAGFEAGDVVLKFNGQHIEFSHDLPHQVGLIAPGTKVNVEVMRRGKIKKLKVTIGELNSDGVASQHSGQATKTRLGLNVRDLDADERRQLDEIGDGDLRGALVTHVEPGSSAAKAGLVPGDIIIQLGFDSVENVKDYVKVAKSLKKGKIVPLRFYRRGYISFRTIKVD